MKKYIKIMLVFTILTLNFIIYERPNIQVYAFSGESKIDLLIANKQKEEELKNKIIELNQSAIAKKEEISKMATEGQYDDEEVEVVSLSFVENEKDRNTSTTKEYVLNEETMEIEDEIQGLEQELEAYIIENVRLEKSIEEEKIEYLQANNLDYIEGCWPVPQYTSISSKFGNRIHPITNKEDFHRGIDIPAPQYTDIISSDDGIVVFSGPQNGYGNVVKIKHFDGKKTVYAHNTLNIVKEGQIVKKGETIAKVGSTGDSTGNHVHFEVIVNDQNINPIEGIQ